MSTISTSNASFVSGSGGGLLGSDASSNEVDGPGRSVVHMCYKGMRSSEAAMLS
jgi:hypothetical protein